LQAQQAIQIKIDGLSLDSTAVKVHPDGTGALKKTVLNPLKWSPNFGQPTKV